MFAGLDDLDWAAMRHAYGSAEGVPGLLRALVDPDPATRETALDAMYGAVHHQGDIYDSTMATVPFLLEALRTPGLPGRAGIAEFLTSLAEADPDRTHIKDAVPSLLAVASDADPELRAAVSPLLALHRDGVELLVQRLATEADGPARQGVLDGLGRTADPAIADRLLEVAAQSSTASTAMAALIAAAHITPERIPADRAVELLKRAYAEDAEPPPPAGFETKTLIGAIRAEREKSDATRRNPHASRFIDTFAKLLGPRVAERTAIVTELLRDPHTDVVQDALFASMHLIERWRGDFREVVQLVGGHLAHPDEEVCAWAERGLNHWLPLSAPVADALAARAARGDGLVRYEAGPPSLSPALDALISLGDERAFPMLVAIVEGAERPRGLAQRLGAYPQHAERVVELLLAGDAKPGEMAGALAACGEAARPAVPRLVSEPLDSWTARALGRIGGDRAVDALREALRGSDVPVAVAAAAALWRLEAAPEAIEVLGSHLKAPNALQEVATIGPAAHELLPKIRPMLKISDRWHWTPVRAAIAVWRITGDAGAATPALVAGWHGNGGTRGTIAEQAAAIAALAPLFEAELAEVERRGTDDYSFVSDQVARDEQLLTACREAIR
ncbi:hypothetical protein ACQPZX_09045 [Actinoplanes sp. CA-142083]|uniref:hypothetical protein n=1 Tax=Actinoplanes sp. CA-142083 TaxID=3239903 RepID=UPI003D93AC25